MKAERLNGGRIGLRGGILLVFGITLFAATPPQAWAATEASKEALVRELRELNTVVLKKIESDAETIGRAFADARNIERSLGWAAIWNAPLEVIKGTISSVGAAIELGSPDALTKLLEEPEGWLELAGLLFTYAGLREAGGRLQLALYGPDYVASVRSMLEEADQSVSLTSFDGGSYATTIRLHLLGVGGRESPVVVPLSSQVSGERKKELVRGLREAKRFLSREIENAIERVKKGSFPEGHLARLTESVSLTRRRVLESKSRSVLWEGS